MHSSDVVKLYSCIMVVNKVLYLENLKYFCSGASINVVKITKIKLHICIIILVHILILFRLCLDPVAI